MKKYILLLIVPFLSFGQEIVINGEGKKILLNENGTWELFESKELIVSNDDRGIRFIGEECFEYELKTKEPKRSWNINNLLNNPVKFDSPYQNELTEKKFDVNSHEILTYDEDFNRFLVIDKNGRTGFSYNFCDSIMSGIEADTLFHTSNDLISYFSEIDQSRRLNYDPKHPIEIQFATAQRINSAGGVDVKLDWYYLDKNKDIKYLVVSFEGYNAVGDEVDFGRVKVTGPIDAGHYTPVWSNVWYDFSTCCVKVSRVEVEYMDGTSYIYVKELDKISSPYLKYYCFE